MFIELVFDWVYFFIALPIAGTELYRNCEENGYLVSKNYDNYNVSKCNIKAPGVDPDNIEKEFLYMTMVVNYVENYNYRNGKYHVCLPYFLNAVKKYPNNSIAKYMLCNTLKKMINMKSKIKPKIILEYNNAHPGMVFLLHQGGDHPLNVEKRRLEALGHEVELRGRFMSYTHELDKLGLTEKLMKCSKEEIEDILTELVK